MIYRFIKIFFLTVFSGWFLVLDSLGQTPGDLENWNPGFVVTIDEDTIYGPIRIHFANEVVQINENNAIKTYGVNQLTLVFLKENETERERFFYTFPFHPYSDYKPSKLFEMLFSGKYLCLLGREILVTETIPVYDSFTFRTYYNTRTKLSTDFYFMFEGEKVKAFDGSRKSLLHLLSDKADELKKFTSTNKLTLTQKEDLIKIITEYNKLKAAK